jgi:hypothetical protein
MRKTLTLLSFILITLVSLNVSAQDDIKTYTKSYFGVIGGVSNPQSNFGQTTYSNNSAGFAKRGVTFGLNGAYYFYKNFAFAASLTFQDQGELSQNDAQNLANGYNTSYNTDQTDVTTVNRYHNVFLMGGPQYSYAYHKFTVDIQADAGLIKSYSTPATTVVFDNSTNSLLTLNQLTSTARAFAYGGNIGLRYSFADNWSVGIKGNYVNSNGIEIVNQHHTANAGGRLDNKQPITVFQAIAGITLLF